jgi:hypothetical protein
MDWLRSFVQQTDPRVALSVVGFLFVVVGAWMALTFGARRNAHELRGEATFTDLEERSAAIGRRSLRARLGALLTVVGGLLQLGSVFIPPR